MDSDILVVILMLVAWFLILVGAAVMEVTR